MKQSTLVSIAFLATTFLSDVMSLAPTFVPRPSSTGPASSQGGISTALHAASIDSSLNAAMLESTMSLSQEPQSTSWIPNEATIIAQPPAAGAALLKNIRMAVLQKSELQQQQNNKGVFSPLVSFAKQVLGDQKLNKIRSKAVSLHYQTFCTFVGTVNTPFGSAVLKVLFNLLDQNQNGRIEECELAKALWSIGFDLIKENQVHGIFEFADLDHSGFLDLEEWIKMAFNAPAWFDSLQRIGDFWTSLSKLTASNGQDAL